MRQGRSARDHNGDRKRQDKLMELLNELKEKLVDSIDLSRDVSDEELREIISELVMSHEENLSLKEKLKLTKDLFNSVRGLDVLEEILKDDEITEIMVNGYKNIFIERKGRLYRYPQSFSSEERLCDMIQSIAAGANKRVNESSPIVDTRLKDGSRINIVLKPVAIDGPVVTIRKFPKSALSMEDLIKMGSITQEAADYLKGLVESGYNIFISGGTGSGKTTFLNVLSNYIPNDQRVITIEDSAELQIKNIPNLIRMECRQANVEGENEVTIRDLIKTSLRMRPDRIVVGEVRGPEALDMLQAMNTGHDGSLSTGHANSPKDMFSRLETMVLTGCDMPLAAIKMQIASAIDIMVHLGRLRDGSRKVLEISEVLGLEKDTIGLNPLFVYNGALERTGKKLINTQKGGHIEKAL